MERQCDRAVRTGPRYGSMSVHQIWNHHCGSTCCARQPWAPGNEPPPPKAGAVIGRSNSEGEYNGESPSRAATL
eukprot:4123342-Lingulodinium_polyedra.AAC.1